MQATELKWTAIAIALVAVCSTGPGTAVASAALTVDVIPQPAHVAQRPGVFELRPGPRLVVPPDSAAVQAALFFAHLLRETRGMTLEVAEHPGEPQGGQAVVFKIDRHAALAHSPEGYTLDISPERVVLSAGDPRGLLYAAVTLWELCTSDLTPSESIRLPAMRIDDAPRFAWRGLMLDSARHFQSPAFILHLIDWMALHKLNMLQWHLTDDQAWRLEIRKYPRLTGVGAWRVPAGAGPAADIDPVTGRARLYGGFYSQRTVREIVAHAAQRNVTIVPEIDMPGHATAAIVAYPMLASSQPAPKLVPSDWGVYQNLYNLEEGTFSFLEDVLSEVIDLFPGKYIDVGGDEAVKEQWKASARIQSRMHELRLPDEQSLQSYFLGRMEKFLAAHGRRLVGWDEILAGGIAPGATVMSWRGIEGAMAAVAAGHDTVLSPSPTLYLDYRQGNAPDEPPGRGRIITLQDVYRFDPALPGLALQQTHVLGLQANIWTEHIRTEDRVQYMTFPRAAALAEIAWSPAPALGWESFLARLPDQLRRYRVLGIHASDDVFAVSTDARLDSSRAHVRIRLSDQAQTREILYTTDGSDPTAASPRYTGPVTVPVGGQLRAAAFAGGRELGGVATQSLEVAALERRSSHELKSCTNKLVLSLEDDAPVNGKRAVFLVDIMNPCWIYEAADLSQVTALRAGVGQVPFNFQLGADLDTIKLDKPRTADGELEVRVDGCDGERIAVMPLAPAVPNNGVTQLPAAPIAPRTGTHDLCLRFATRTLNPLWLLDWVQTLE